MSSIDPVPRTPLAKGLENTDTPILGLSLLLSICGALFKAEKKAADQYGFRSPLCEPKRPRSIPSDPVNS